MQVLIQRCDQWARAALPALLTFLCVVIGATGLALPALGPVMPAFGLMAVYYWAVHRPDLLGPLTIFLFGLLADALTGLTQLPFGLATLGFLVAYGLVRRHRHVFADQSFRTLWIGLAIVTLTTAMLQWLILSLVAWQMMPLAALLIQTALTLTLFPPLALLFILVQKYLLR